ncbi:MAG: sulfotransferase [Desulfovibrionaceae bacterium]
MDRPLDVIAILGLSYCGSTLLNLMLDSHPDIRGVGEIWTLVTPDSGLSTTCANCGEACPRFTPERRRALERTNFYPDIAGFFPTDVLADSSKTLEWYAQSTRFPSRRPIRFTPVLVVKHPIRQLLSFMLHLDLSGRNRITPWAWLYRATGGAVPRGRNERRPLPQRLARAALFSKLLYWYLWRNSERFRREIPEVFGGAPLTIRYEDLVAAPDKTLRPLLERLGLAYDPAMADCYAHVHHQIGGNSGTLCQLTGQRAEVEAGHPCNKQYYGSIKNITRDDRYLDFFSDEELRRLENNDLVKRLCDAYGYAVTP